MDHCSVTGVGVIVGYMRHSLVQNPESEIAQGLQEYADYLTGTESKTYLEDFDPFLHDRH